MGPTAKLGNPLKHLGEVLVRPLSELFSWGLYEFGRFPRRFRPLLSIIVERDFFRVGSDLASRRQVCLDGSSEENSVISSAVGNSHLVRWIGGEAEDVRAVGSLLHRSREMHVAREKEENSMVCISEKRQSSVYQECLRVGQCGLGTAVWLLYLTFFGGLERTFS